jgi:hypothetical protein
MKIEIQIARPDAKPDDGFVQNVQRLTPDRCQRNPDEPEKQVHVGFALSLKRVHAIPI